MISDRLLGTKCCVPRLPDPLMAAGLAEAGCVELSGSQGLDAALDGIRRRARPCVPVPADVQELCSRAAQESSSST